MYIYETRTMLLRKARSPRLMRRRRREHELEERRQSSSSDTSPLRHSSDDTLNFVKSEKAKAQSASPSRLLLDEGKKIEQRRSYRQYIRDKRSRSREKARAASADRLHPRHVQTQFLDASFLSHVHWKVHRRPLQQNTFDDYQKPADKKDGSNRKKVGLSNEMATLSQSIDGTFNQFYHNDCNRIDSSSHLDLMSSSQSHARQEEVDDINQISNVSLDLKQCRSRNRDESSPLDTVPVKESTLTLKISENSAFRPIQPSDITAPRFEESLFSIKSTDTKLQHSSPGVFLSSKQHLSNVDSNIIMKNDVQNVFYHQDEPIYDIMKQPRYLMKRNIHSTSSMSVVQQKLHDIEKSFGQSQIENMSTEHMSQNKWENSNSTIYSQSNFPHELKINQEGFTVIQPKAESNLERWKARKRNLEMVKNELPSVNYSTILADFSTSVGSGKSVIKRDPIGLCPEMLKLNIPPPTAPKTFCFVKTGDVSSQKTYPLTVTYENQIQTDRSHQENDLSNAIDPVITPNISQRNHEAATKYGNTENNKDSEKRSTYSSCVKTSVGPKQTQINSSILSGHSGRTGECLVKAGVNRCLDVRQTLVTTDGMDINKSASPSSFNRRLTDCITPPSIQRISPSFFACHSHKNVANKTQMFERHSLVDNLQSHLLDLRRSDGSNGMNSLKTLNFGVNNKSQQCDPAYSNANASDIQANDNRSQNDGKIEPVVILQGSKQTNDLLHVTWNSQKDRNLIPSVNVSEKTRLFERNIMAATRIGLYKDTYHQAKNSSQVGEVERVKSVESIQKSAIARQQPAVVF